MIHRLNKSLNYQVGWQRSHLREIRHLAKEGTKGKSKGEVKSAGVRETELPEKKIGGG